VLHGIQLARTRPVVGRNLVGATFSFTRFLRSWRSRGSVRREICQSVAGSLLIDTTPREAAESEQQAVALNILFGAGGRRNPFRDVVRSTLETLSRPPTELRIRLPAAAADRPRWDIVTEVTVEVLNALLSKSWVVGSEGRWTHTLRILARFVVGCLLGGLLPAALEGARARAFAGVSMDLESQLAAQVAKELGEQTDASRKLRLLRLCKNLCTPGARWQAPGRRIRPEVAKQGPQTTKQLRESRGTETQKVQKRRPHFAPGPHDEVHEVVKGAEGGDQNGRLPSGLWRAEVLAQPQQPKFPGSLRLLAQLLGDLGGQLSRSIETPAKARAPSRASGNKPPNKQPAQYAKINCMFG